MSKVKLSAAILCEYVVCRICLNKFTTPWLCLLARKFSSRIMISRSSNKCYLSNLESNLCISSTFLAVLCGVPSFFEIILHFDIIDGNIALPTGNLFPQRNEWVAWLLPTQCCYAFLRVSIRPFVIFHYSLHTGYLSTKRLTRFSFHRFLLPRLSFQ